MSKVVIIHYAPAELYPPVQNIVNVLNDKSVDFLLLTTKSDTLDFLFLESPQIIRLGKSGRKMSSLLRYWNYLYFNLCAFFILLKSRPDKILYIETLSAFPAYLYKRYINKSVGIYIHYHEYKTRSEYKNGMVLQRFFYDKEKWLYDQAQWISHTNEYRMEMFKKDLEPKVLKFTHILPNYPPLAWYQIPRLGQKLPLQIVYVGSLSLDTMYLKEICDWVISQKGLVVLDLYTQSNIKQIKSYITTLNSEYIKLMGGVPYSNLPKVLVRYDVGVVLYKGHIPNYVYNAPNKLFEYLACGLDVWFPDVMLGSMPYVQINGLQKVVPLDFTALKNFKFESVLREEGQLFEQGEYFCEYALDFLINKLSKIE